MKLVALRASMIAAAALVASGTVVGARPNGAAGRIVVAQADKPAGEGKINSVDAGARKVNITHGPVAALKWPGMTMDFTVAPSVDMSALKAGAEFGFTLKQGADGHYMIDSLQSLR